MALTLDHFGWAELERRSAADGIPLEQLVARAWSAMRERFGSDRPALRVPRFAQGRGGDTRELTIEMAKGDLLALKVEAEHQDVALKDLLVHALMLSLAESPEE